MRDGRAARPRRDLVPRIDLTPAIQASILQAVAVSQAGVGKRTIRSRLPD
jgi:hypothetical protein